jgi:hypothetical protein
MPNTDDSWLDPKTLIAIGGLTIGVLGFLFGILRDRWSHRESRLDALGKVLHPVVRAAQDLMRANNARRTAEQLKFSYPEQPRSVLEGVDIKASFPPRTPQVLHRINSLIEDYGKLMESSERNFRDAESELATRHFRFPTAIVKQVKTLHECLGELGRLTSGGLFDKADLQLAQFRDQYKEITKTAKGWRLADPIEGIRSRFRQREDSSELRESEFELTKEEMEGVMELVHRRATTHSQNTFAVHPPQKLIDNPALMESDEVIEELKDSIFSVVFQDGTSQMLTLPELMAFTFNLIVLAHEFQQVEKMVSAAEPTSTTNVKVSFQFAMQQIMTPETVKVLLAKVEFSDTPSDA